ncbi:efflux RND transporter periplasmic adaptor subunit [Microbulbifer halophilus]|nr:efflux RND transporter periplasmic adaptor subunit [Microbulbifer halophilus]
MAARSSLALLLVCFIAALSNPAFASGDHAGRGENHVNIDSAMADRAGIETAVAGPGEIRRTITLYGKTALAHGNLSHVHARFPGSIVSVAVEIGDRVRKGQTLAKIESNDSLQVYAITAPIAGQVIDKRASRGEYSGERELFTIANYDRLWVELRVFPGQQPQIERGQQVTLSNGDRQLQAEIGNLVPASGGQPFKLARASIDNRELGWPADLMLEGRVLVERVKVPLVVENRALQPRGGRQVVFVQKDDSYQARPLKLGRSDGRVTEVLGGLKAGERYVTANSYLIKAHLEKSGASHAH